MPEGIKPFYYNPDNILSEPGFWAFATAAVNNKISGMIFCTLEGIKGIEMIEGFCKDAKKIFSLPIIHLKLRVKIKSGRPKIGFFIRDEGKIAFDNLL